MHRTLRLPSRTIPLLATAVCAAALCACREQAPAGQVVATVGGRDVTLQDVRAEGRADGVPDAAGATAEKMLLQRVIDRTLLAQSAQRQGLDRTPAAPSDLLRIEQAWRADKAAKSLLVGLPAPGDAEAQKFIASHPFAFAKRERVSARTITIAASPTIYNQLKTYRDYDAALAFIKHLGVKMVVGQGQVDTAQLPTNVASQLVDTSTGALLVTQPPGRVQVAEIMGHTPVKAGPQEELLTAKRALSVEAVQRRLAAELARLKAATPVRYQPGYAPAPAPTTTTAGGT